MPTDINVSQLIINKLTKAQYEEARLAGNISNTELYFITDDYQNELYDAKGSADNALSEAKSYADTIGTNVKNDLLNGAGDAYDTLKELGELIDENVDAIQALEVVASGKQNKITGIAGQFVVIGNDGNATTKTIPYAEEASF